MGAAGSDIGSSPDGPSSRPRLSMSPSPCSRVPGGVALSFEVGQTSGGTRSTTMSSPPDGPRPATDAAWGARVTEALSSISDAVYFLDHADRFTWVNAAAERLLAHPAAHLLGRTVWDAFPALLETDVPATYHRARQTQQMHEVEVFYEPLDRWLGGWV